MILVLYKDVIYMLTKKAFNKKTKRKSNPFVRLVSLDAETCRIFDNLKKSQNGASATIRIMLLTRKNPSTPEQAKQALMNEIKALQMQWEKETHKVDDFYQGQIYLKQKRIEEINDIVERQKVEKKLTEFTLEAVDDDHH